MKFKISKKDLIIFIIFAVFLLYLTAIAVVNFSFFARTGEFYGLSPFLAFTGEYLPATLMIFVGLMALIFTSVSSYIFNKDKSGGFGIKIGEKSSDGYARWADQKEIKTSKDIEKVSAFSETVESAGIPLINNGKEIWVDNGESHSLIIGATGSGKTEVIVKPMVNLLAKKGESMIIMDPKGELYIESAEYLKSHGYNIKVLNFREPHLGSAWNPLNLPYLYYQDGNKDKANELLEDVALNILYDPSNKNDGGFWEKSAADYFAGLALGLFEDAKEEQVNINSIFYMATVGEEKFAASNYVKEYFGLKNADSQANIFASNTINAPTETKGGILSTFRQKIRAFASREKLSEMLSHSDFDMRDVGKEKTAIFIVIHDEKTTYHSLATIFIKQCYECLVDEAQKNGGKLIYRTNFILDEFANMPPLKDVDAMVTAARSRQIRFNFIIQNFSQLKDIYGEKAGTIRGNCGNTIYLISTELQALEEISKIAGEVKVTGEKEKSATRPLVSITDLQKMKLFEAIILRVRAYPFKTKYTPYFEMSWYKDNKKASFVEREVTKTELFDLKEFVTTEKRKKLMASLDNPIKEPNPMMGGMDSPMFNPFGPSKPSGFDPMPGISDLKSSDVDEMIKNIDKKIAELEAQERAEKEKAAKASMTKGPASNIEPPKEDTIDGFNIYNKTPEVKETKPTFSLEDTQELNLDVKPLEEKKEEIKPQVTETKKPVVNLDTDSVIVNNNVVTDDEFFDDFFGDD